MASSKRKHITRVEIEPVTAPSMG